MTRQKLVARMAILAMVAMPLGAQYVGGAVEGGGTITGKVSWDGARPELSALEVNKDVEVCDIGGKGERASNRLLLSKDGGIANAVVYLDGITQGKPAASEGATLGQVGCRYEPHVLVMPRKAELAMTSSDAILHNIHMFDAANYNIPFPDQNSISKKMRKAGVVRIQCDAGHGWMSAYVHVTNHPYYAVTAADGSFELGDVPPGKYTIRMWHEGWDVAQEIMKEGVVAGYEFGDPVEQTQEVEVAAGAEATVAFKLSE